MTYKVIRKFFSDKEDELVAEELTLEEAKAHCNHKEASSRTCTSDEGIERTSEHGLWFDAFYQED